jgi:ParB-like chromosome segregation protein Spo0J
MAQLRELGQRGASIIRMPLNQINVITDPNDPNFNLRTDYGDIDELARQIVESGQQEPGKVRLSDDGKCAVLVEGHRRLKAIQIANEKLNAGIDVFLCLPEDKGTNAETRIVEMFVRNSSGKPYTILEQAEAIRRLQNKQWDVSKIAKSICKTGAYVNQLLCLQGSSSKLRDAVRKNTISSSAALKLAAAPITKQEDVLGKVQEAISPAKTPKGKISKKKPIKVKDVERELKGVTATVSTRKIRDTITEVNKLIEGGKKASQWKAVKYGLELALGKAKLDPSFSA